MDTHRSADEPLPDEPLHCLEPVPADPSATLTEHAEALELRMQLILARTHLAIAQAWDSGRLSRQDPERPPFEAEVLGLLGVGGGQALDYLEIARAQLDAVETRVVEAESARAGRTSSIEALARDFELRPIALLALLCIVGPRLRPELARMYKLLANDAKLPLVDEQLLVTLLGDEYQRPIARELDADRPLRRFGLITVDGERPSAALTVDPLVVRFLADRPYDGEVDRSLDVRHVERDLEELEMPRALVIRAMRFLASPRDGGHARFVVRGRTGAGRHTLVISLAARAGRSVALIDIANLPRETSELAAELEAALRRARLRGLVPCVDGLESVSADDPDRKIAVASVLRRHPGPLALRLPPEAEVPLDPGYLLLELPPRSERERVQSWSNALERYDLPAANAIDLAARYRIGPGTIDRVCVQLARRPDRPRDAAGCTRELDEAVRQHLDNRLGKTAERVRRLASWSDIVLPEDIIDSLVELTARVRHRRKVFEAWGFESSITTARGITALFQGSPGTGKTMVAGVIARDLGLDLYRVDVSKIASRWIGETEKNLGALFDAAEDGQVMLLFDEADSLFGKRTEVKTSADRYANTQVNYLLQRLDSFEGIAVLTTNFGKSIDSAFKRRLTYRVTFPFPDDEMREQLWRTMLPPQVPIDGRIDFAMLARRFRLSGGYIRNSALRAAFLAAEEGVSLSQGHIERAIKMEFNEIGKLAESGVLE